IFLRFSLTRVKSFSILRSTYRFATPLVSAGKPAIPHSQAVLTPMVDTASLFFCILLLPLPGLDHGVGHSLLLLYDVKAPTGQKEQGMQGLRPFSLSPLFEYILYLNQT